METVNRPMLMRKTMPDLRHMMRRMGGDSPVSESKESLVSRILLFSPQKWEQEIRTKPAPITPVTEKQLKILLHFYIAKGLKLVVKDNCWFVSFNKRKDSGTLLMPATAIERSVKYLMV